jgi:4-amino-4-deoxy-L-arabinose transferase-like glycosyltransferase
MTTRPGPGTSSAQPPAPIPALPGLGTTWYERGARYWLRRTFGAVVWFAVLAFFVYIALVLYGSFRDDLSPTVRTVWDWAQVVASCGTLVWGWQVQRRDHRKKLQDPPTPDQARQNKRNETGRSVWLALAGRLFFVIAAPVMPACAAWCVGWVVAAFTVREYPSEVGARRAMRGD